MNTYFWQPTTEQQPRPDRHHPSQTELQGMKRRIEEEVGSAMIDLQRLNLPVSVSAPLQRAIGDYQSVLESIALHLSESADIRDAH